MDDYWEQFWNNLYRLKDLGMIGIADVLGNGISAFFWFYMASILEPEQYGEIHYFLGIAGIAASVSLIGTQNTITVYTAKSIKIQSTFYFISLTAGAIAAFVIILFFYRIDTSVVLFGYIINTLAIGELLGRKLYSSYSKYVLTQKILTLGLGVGFYYIFGVEGIIYALALSYVAYVVRIYKGIRESKIDFSPLRSRIGFITSNYVLSLVGGFIGQIDKLIIAPLLGFAFLGNYSLALQVISVLMIFSQIMFKYILPQDSTGNQNRKLKKIVIFIAIGITVLGMLLSPYMISTFFPKYIQVKEAIQIMSFSIIPSTISMIYTSRFLGLEKSKFILIGTSISLVIIVTGIIVLGSMFDIIGVAIAFVLSSTFNAVFLVIASRFIK